VECQGKARSPVDLDSVETAVQRAAASGLEDRDYIALALERTRPPERRTFPLHTAEAVGHLNAASQVTKSHCAHSLPDCAR
jgi:hypothetical protein